MTEKKRMTFYFEVEPIETLKDMAQGRPTSYMINSAIKEYIEKNKDKAVKL